jgi:hypothetical protein
MVSKSDLRNAFLKRAVLSKAVWIPIAFGGATMALASGMPFWIGVGSATFGIGMAIWRLTRGRRATEEAVIQQFRNEADRQHYAYLRSLQRKLRRDRDATTGRLLRQLREIHKRMVEADVFATVASTSPQDSSKAWQSEVRDQMAKLYESSVGSLERSYKLWSNAQSVADHKLQQELLSSRSQLLKEVEESVQRLGKTLDQMQVSSIKTEQPQNELSELRQELEQGLTVAENIEKRIKELDNQVREATRPGRES